MPRPGIPSLLMLCCPLASAADEAGQWYVNPSIGGITPDKPWGGTGGAVLYGLDVGTHLSSAWSAEISLNGAPLNDRFEPGHIWLYGGALNVLRVFERGAAVAPYVSLGAGATHVAPPSPTPLESRTEFMVQPGFGAIVQLWQSSGGGRSLALRPDIKVRWTHGWAHAPGNPVDILYVLGLTFSFAGTEPRTPD